MMKRTMLRLAMCGLLLTATGAQAEDETSAIEILKKVDEATKKVKSAHLKITVKWTGGPQDATEVEGTARYSGWSFAGPEKSYYDFAVNRPGEDAPLKLTAGSDGENFYIIDHKSKIAYQDIDPGVYGSFAGMVGNFPMIEFVHPSPFTDEMNGQEQKLVGTESVEGEDCYKIDVTYAKAAQRATWYFSKKDFLPRRVDRQLGGRGTRSKIIKVIDVSEKPSEADFSLKLPEGYKLTDDFAP